jgi:hypothetical protein
MSMRPEQLVKLSGIGCSSKTTAYFVSGGHGFNSVHGRMPSIARGADDACVLRHGVELVRPGQYFTDPGSLTW